MSYFLSTLDAKFGQGVPQNLYSSLFPRAIISSLGADAHLGLVLLEEGCVSDPVTGALRPMKCRRCMGSQDRALVTVRSASARVCGHARTVISSSVEAWCLAQRGRNTHPWREQSDIVIGIPRAKSTCHHSAKAATLCPGESARSEFLGPHASALGAVDGAHDRARATRPNLREWGLCLIRRCDPYE